MLALIPSNFLEHVHILPDGTYTTDSNQWLGYWFEYALPQIYPDTPKGQLFLDVHNVDELHDDIMEIYIKDSKKFYH